MREASVQCLAYPAIVFRGDDKPQTRFVVHLGCV